MAEFALLINDVFVETRNYDERPQDIEHKNVSWHPVIREYGDPATSGLEGDDYHIRTVDPATVPPSKISDRQFFQQIAAMGLITEQEAEDAVASGIIPTALMELVNMLPEQARHPARMYLKGATEFHRHHEMTDTIAWLYGFNEQQVDELFIAAGNLV